MRRHDPSLVLGMPRLHVLLTQLEIDRAESLTDWAAKKSEIAPTGNAKRSHVLREAIRRGLDSLERQRKREARETE